MVEQQMIQVTKEPGWIKIAVAVIGVIGTIITAWFTTRKKT